MDDREVAGGVGSRGRARPFRARLRFASGILLIGASFLVYPAYPLIVFLPLTEGARVSTTVVAAAASWGVFAAGLYLAGRVGYRWLKRRVKR